MFEKKTKLSKKLVMRINEEDYNKMIEIKNDSHQWKHWLHDMMRKSIRRFHKIYLKESSKE